MKKYKLIKDFPNCPVNIGTIVYYDNAAKCYYSLKELTRHKVFGEYSIENYPEFWEEIKEPEFEIFKIRVPKTGEIYCFEEVSQIQVL